MSPLNSSGKSCHYPCLLPGKAEDQKHWSWEAPTIEAGWQSNHFFIETYQAPFLAKCPALSRTFSYPKMASQVSVL